MPQLIALIFGSGALPIFNTSAICSSQEPRLARSSPIWINLAVGLPIDTTRGIVNTRDKGRRESG